MTSSFTSCNEGQWTPGSSRWYGQPLGALPEIPDVKFDNSLLMISPPKNIPTPHRDKLDSVVAKIN